MNDSIYKKRLEKLITEHEELITKKNTPENISNGLFKRYKNPVLTATHTPLFWRYDFNKESNPFLMERQGINAVFNPAAIKYNGKYCLVARVEGADRKSFFAVAESKNGIDNFKFHNHPITIPELEDADVNVYDMRLTEHEDGEIYGVFCTERKDPNAPLEDTSTAIVQCGIVRTRDLITWERLDDLKTSSFQQRNCVLHPEFINGRYAFYTRPQDGFITAGTGGGIGWGLSDRMEQAIINDEKLVDSRKYHTIKEVKNGLGPAPIKTKEGWLHIAHGVRNTAAGLRYVLYSFISDLNKPWKIIHQPAGIFMGPHKKERVGDVSNVLFCNGVITDDDGRLLIYYASSDTRTHVAETTVDKMLDYCLNTPEDPLTSAKCVELRNELIENNLDYFKITDIFDELSL